MGIPIGIMINTMVYHATANHESFVFLHISSRGMEQTCRPIHRLCIDSTSKRKKHYEYYDVSY